MRLNDKKMRRILIGLGVILLCVLVWWGIVYSPLKEKISESNIRLEQLTIDQHKLEKKLKKLTKAIRDKSKTSKKLKHLPRTVKAKTLEEANAVIQAKMQSFFGKHDIQLSAYKELTPGKWGSYQLGRVEFRVSCTEEKLAELLEFVKRQEEGIRVDRLEINSRMRKGSKLRVTLRLASLFIRGGAKRM
ncbi:MAG: hypothetical protein DRH12_01515 [Deltaproteobacteria bacterium]|nr:MAG: hypothetical protein DRH12_01515 [Deltaproteobacteria bacterium]